MEEYYAVYLGNHPVGKVQVEKQGLYYHFICRCKLNNEMMCRLYVTCNGKKENLGFLIPVGDGFGLEKKLPVKRLGQGNMEFCLLPKTSVAGKFVPIYPEEPFSYIEHLKECFFAIQNEQPGLMIK